VTSLVIANDA